MPDARYYVRQAKILLSMSADTCDPALSARLRGVAADHLAKALKLKMPSHLRMVSKSPASEIIPEAPDVGPACLPAASPSSDTATLSLVAQQQ
jgi:hypothetical protein